MDCFRIRWRTAQVYVQAVEHRLRSRAVRECPLFYLQLSRLQRDLLLQGLFGRTRRPEELPAKDLALLTTTAIKVLDSRDRVASALFQVRDANPKVHGTLPWKAPEVHESVRLVRPAAAGGEEEPPEGAGTAAPRLPAGAAEGAFGPLPPEIRGRLLQKMGEGLSPEAAVEQVFAEVKQAAPFLHRDLARDVGCLPAGRTCPSVAASGVAPTSVVSACAGRPPRSSASPPGVANGLPDQ